VTEALAPFLPAPWVVFTGERYALEYDCPQSIGKIRPYQGVAQNLLKAYAWIMSLGADGLRAVAETAVLNNNYLMHKVVAIRGASAPYATGKRRIEQVRYSWAQLTAETGIHSEDIGARVVDFGTHYWTSHHPFVVPEPMTLEPTESYSQGDLDEYAAILGQVAAEAYSDPELVRTAPHQSTIHKIDHAPLDDPQQWAITWRAYQRKRKECAGLD
jgi:glycine dehydrogenase subunit 2